MSYWSDITNQSRQRQSRNLVTNPGSKNSVDTPGRNSPTKHQTDWEYDPVGLPPDHTELTLGTPAPGSTGGRGRGYGGPRQYDMDLIKNLLGRKPADYSAMQVPKYSAPEFYKFDGTAYAKARQALAEGLSSDIQSGQGAYDAARIEMEALQRNPYRSSSSPYRTGRSIPQPIEVEAPQGNPYRSSSSPYRTGRSIPQPAESALNRFGGAVDTSGAAAGNAAFAELRSILSGAHSQRQAAEARALEPSH